MEKFRFSLTSKKQLETVHKDLQLITEAVLKVTMTDFAVVQGYRSPEEQRKLFDKKLTHCDGYLVKSAHNQQPSIAIDILAYVNGVGTYDQKYYVYLAGVFQSMAQVLYQEGLVMHLIRWGGNWDNDSEIMTDQKLQDLCHLELRKP